MSVQCGFCEHRKPSQYSMSPRAPWVCQKPDGRKCPRGYSFQGGHIYDGILPYSCYTAEEIWKDVVDITTIELVKKKIIKKEIVTMTKVMKE